MERGQMLLFTQVCASVAVNVQTVMYRLEEVI